MYKPLEFAKNLDFRYIEEGYWHLYKRDIGMDFDSKKDALLDFTMRRDFMSPFYQGEFQNLNRFMIQSAPIFFEKSADNIADWADLLRTTCVVELWKENKQTYLIDDDFIEELMLTDNIKIPANLLDLLPYQTYCIDFVKNSIFPDIDEAFVHVKKDKKSNLLVFIERVLKDIYFSLLICLDEQDLKKEGDFAYYVYSRKCIPKCPDYLELSKDIEKKYENLKIDNKKFNDFCIFNIQLLLYLCAANADIRENPITKNTYRPHNNSKPKNKFSEVRQWDVGVRIGKSIRLSKNKTIKEISASRTPETKERKAVTPHCRRAHWQTYHVGKGRTETVLKWIGITFVGGGKEDIPVTVHKVKK